MDTVGVVLGFQTERTAETVIFPAFALSVLEYGLAGSKEQNAPVENHGSILIICGYTFLSCPVRRRPAPCTGTPSRIVHKNRYDL